jgi:hypothetical protein
MIGQDHPALPGLETCPYCWVATPLDAYCEHEPALCVSCCPAEHVDPRDTLNGAALVEGWGA